jgi:hypothetical protein
MWQQCQIKTIDTATIKNIMMWQQCKTKILNVATLLLPEPD